jgi:hypothetical protein
VERIMAEATRTHRADVRDVRAIAQEQPASNGAVRAGVVAGLGAGAAMLVFVAASAARADLSPARPLALTASLARDAVSAGPGSLVAGALLWAAVSVALALVYVMVVPRDFPYASAALLGVGYSFIVLAVMASVVLPRVNPVMREAMPEIGGSWVLAYVVYGMVLGFVPALRQRWSRRKPG